jgi:tetratricopeptide (TPR) repeat protein
MNFHGPIQGHNAVAGIHTSGGTTILNFAGCALFLTLKQAWKANIETGSSDTGHPNTSTKSTLAYYLPFAKNQRFVGRRDELQELQQKLLIDRECQKIAIVGLGGIGKTQIALEFAQSVKRQRLEYSVFWVPAVSLETFEQACREIARILQIPQAADDKQDVKELVKQHLSDSSVGKWLLIVDNADDMAVMFGAGLLSGVVDFLPENDDGVTVFTSRRGEVVESLVGSDVLEVGKMSEDEAVIFLTASLAQKNRTEDGPIKQLVADLDCLPLAIAQAAAYINTNKTTVAKYLDLIRNTDADLTAVMSREFRDSTRYKQSSNAIATTWVVSFKQILQENADAADLLSFISCIEWKSIPPSLLPIIRPEARMINTIGTICSYGFLTRRENEDVYDMHRLVHLAIKIWLSREKREAEVRKAAMKYMADVFPFGRYEDRERWRAYLPHGSRLMSSKVGDDAAAKAKLALRLGVCLSEDWRNSEAVMWLEQSCEWRERYLVEEDSDRLLSQHELAIVYQANGQIEEAVTLLEHVVKVREKLAEDHPSRLASQHELAGAYQANGQIEEAVTLLEHVVKVREKLAEDHPSRLASQHELARAYQANEQIEEAVTLLEHVVKVREKLAEDHPDRLASQHELARAYQANGQIEEAVTLLKYVVALKKRRYTEAHPSRIVSEEALDNLLRST